MFIFKSRKLFPFNIRFYSSNSRKELLAAIDQSTTGSKLAIFDLNGHLISQNLIPHRQITKQSYWLEHDPLEIVQNIELAIEDTLRDLNQKVIF